MGQYPANNIFPAAPEDVGFVDYASSNYRLSDSSMYKNKGTDGKDIGADVEDVFQRTKGVAP
jgi:hypothetical protein